MIASVAIQFLWKPDYLRSLYLDAADEFGLLFWYGQCQELEKQANKDYSEK